MANQRSIVGRTPAGGSRGTILYRGPDGGLIDESRAVAAEMIEYDERGDVIARTYVSLMSGGNRTGEPVDQAR